MIDLYFAPTPNGLKLRLFLEEARLPYTLKPVSLTKGDQHKPEFLAISPNNKIPAIVDHAPADGGAPITMFESGAIMLYLAERHGVLLPAETRARLTAVQWLFWQMAGLGPMAGQAGHFRTYAPEKIPYAIDRYSNEVKRLFGVLDHQLDGRDFIAGDEYSIADIACYPWIFPHRGLGQDLSTFANLSRWFAAIASRAATQKVYAGIEDTYGKPPTFTEEERKALFGATGKK